MTSFGFYSFCVIYLLCLVNLYKTLLIRPWEISGVLLFIIRYKYFIAPKYFLIFKKRNEFLIDCQECTVCLFVFECIDYYIYVFFGYLVFLLHSNTFNCSIKWFLLLYGYAGFLLFISALLPCVTSNYMLQIYPYFWLTINDSSLITHFREWYLSQRLPRIFKIEQVFIFCYFENFFFKFHLLCFLMPMIIIILFKYTFVWSIFSIFFLLRNVFTF